MGEPLERAAVAVFTVFLGYALKRAGFFTKSDASAIAKLCLNITLPAAIITGFGSYQRDISMVAIILVSALCNAVVLFITWLLTKRSSRRDKIFRMFSVPGYQIGTFTLPFIGSTLGPQGMLITCMFDMGNSFFACGGSYAIVSSLLSIGDDGGRKWRELAKRIFSTVAIDAYVLSFVWVTVFGALPAWVLKLAAPLGAANSSVAMLMIGLMMEIKSDVGELRTVGTTLVMRYAIQAALALVFWFLTPFPRLTRQIVAIVLMSPISALCPLFTEKCGGDTGMSGFAVTLSILISIVVMTLCIAFMGV